MCAADRRRSSVAELRFIGEDSFVEGLEAEPARRRAADLPLRPCRGLVVDVDRSTGGLRDELRLAGPLHGDEPPGGLVDGRADGEEAVVAKDHRLRPPEGLRDAFALVDVEDNTGVVVEDLMVYVEDARILGDRIDTPGQARERLAVEGVRMCRR